MILKTFYSFQLLTVIVHLTKGFLEEDGRIIEFDSFDEFKGHGNKSYAHYYEEFRGRIAYQNNLKTIREHNELYKSGQKSYRLRANNLADLNSGSYLKKFLRLVKSKRYEALDFISDIVGSPLMNSTPESLDWREKGFVTRPNNQGTCGSCYAYSIAQSIEGQVFKRTGKILSLSPQQIVDCSVSFGNQGCTGGSLRNTLRYLEATGGIMRFNDYKYTGRKGKCQFVPELAVVNVTSWAIMPSRDEKAIQAAVAHIGPVAVSINATPRTFQLYSDGIYDDDNCSSSSVNHAMLVVGYTPDYWILKNWWGDQWGEDGYMRIRKGKNACGIANYAAYSVV